MEIKCPKCDSKNIEIIPVNGRELAMDMKCKDCDKITGLVY